MVVTLKEQIRVVDPIWIDIFRHLRHEQVEPRHIKTLEELCPTNPLSPATDFSQKPWNSAVLVTPRHTIRTEWNRHALRKHCVDNNHQLFVVPRTGCRSLNSAEVDALLARISNSKTENNELPVTLELAIGMPVLVTQNLHTGHNERSTQRSRRHRPKSCRSNPVPFSTDRSASISTLIRSGENEPFVRSAFRLRKLSCHSHQPHPKVLPA